MRSLEVNAAYQGNYIPFFINLGTCGLLRSLEVNYGHFFRPKWLFCNSVKKLEAVVENAILIAFLGGLISSLRNNKSGRRIRSVTYHLKKRRSVASVKDAFWEVKTFKNMTFFDNDKKEKSKRPYLSLETIFQLWTQKIPNFNVSVLFHGV